MRYLLLLLLLLLPVLANAASPEQRKTDSPPTKSVEKSEKSLATTPSIQPAPPPVLPASVVVAGKVEVVSEQLKKEPKSPEERQHETIKFWSDIVLAIATAGLFIFTALLYCVTRGLLLEARKQFPHFKANVKAAADAASAAQKSVDLSREEFIATHRPEIRLKHLIFSGPQDPETPTGIDLILVNKGSTEAKIIGFNIRAVAIDHNDMLPAFPQFPNPLIQLDSPHDVLASGVTLHFNKAINGPGLTDEEFADVVMNRKTMYCFGRIEYKDQLGIFRTTGFCRKLIRTPQQSQSREYGRWERVIDPDYEYQD